jgi:hypothetical protein
MADRSSTRIKRKPAPEFPYSSRYPPPDPSDPFAPLSVLRARAHSSTTALDNVFQNALTPATDPYSTQRPGTAESRRTYYQYVNTVFSVSFFSMLMVLVPDKNNRKGKFSVRGWASPKGIYLRLLA